MLFLSTVLIASPSEAEPYCTREAFENGDPAGLIGKYEIIGKTRDTGKTYSGQLSISSGKNSYLLSRTVNGQNIKGEAWFERCSMDRFKVLAVTYQTKAEASKLFCFLRFDGDNYTRASCTFYYKDKQGLEAWFQQP
jgi:hypothetical protein